MFYNMDESFAIILLSSTTSTGSKDNLLGKILNMAPGMMFDVPSLLEEPLNPELLVHLSELQGDGEDMLSPVPAALHKYHGVHADYIFVERCCGWPGLH